MVNREVEKGVSAVYELCFLILPSIPEDKLGNVMEGIRKAITNVGGVEIDAESPVKHPLAYSMSKTVGASRYTVNDAYIGWIKFEAEISKVGEIKSEVEKMSEILRLIIVNAPRKTTFTFAKASTAKSEGEESVEAIGDGVVEEVGVE